MWYRGTRVLYVICGHDTQRQTKHNGNGANQNRIIYSKYENLSLDLVSEFGNGCQFSTVEFDLSETTITSSTVKPSNNRKCQGIERIVFLLSGVFRYFREVGFLRSR